ncbi:uncharacterized protein LOC131207707 [Anopheles bellator]|uniref:uncharacterized protein LOC131207707 n=1 Tax=Anopheles bellator TaxID=139047 RepID=UPI00264862E4|nr:uncharacterized protein LOC131207707 [Anopheles bellator]
MRFARSTHWMLLVVAATLLTIASGQLSSVVRQPPQQYSSPQQQQLAARQQKYSGNINLVSDSVTNLAQRIARAISNQKSKTEIFSPVSIAGALSLLLLGSGGQTQKELLKVMGLDSGALSFQDIHLGFGRLFQDLVSNEPSLEPLVTWRQNDKCNRFDEEEEEDDYPLPPAANSANVSSHDQHKISLANGIFLQDQYNLSQWYRTASMDLYQSEVRSLDFDDDPVGSTNQVNQWVNEKTHGKIPNILPTTLPSTTTLVLASAMYFRAIWHKTFIEGATKQREFFPDGYDEPPIMVDMMGHGGCFPSYESPELDARILGIPYKRRLSTMYVIMPNNSTRAKLLDLMAKLNSDNISQMINSMTIKTTIVLFPKMHIGNTLNLKRVLAMLGVRSLFTPDRSNLTAMVSEPPAGSELFLNRFQDVTSMPGWEGRPTVNIPPYVPNLSQKQNQDLTQGLTFSRVQPNEPDTAMASDDVTATQPVTTALPESREPGRPKRDVSYKVPSSKRGQSGPLRSKDFILNKRIIKEKGPIGKKGLRRRMKRATTETGKALYVSSATHQIDLDINEMGTEGGAATIITLNRSGSSVVFRANAPFLLLIRNDRTGLPLFYGAVFDPTECRTEVEIHLANGIFAQDGTAFDDRYNALAKKLYKSELQYLDFVGSESKSVRAINGWVYNQTRGRIGDILSHISPETILLIVNTLYFRGLWEEPFLNLATRPRRFFPNGPEGPGSFDVPTMAKSGCMPYYFWKEENVRVLGIPYQQNVTMYIFLPNNSTRALVTALHEKISAQTINEIVTKMTMKSVSLLLPQMHVSNAFSLKSAFQQMGLYALFDRETADLYHLLTSKRRGDGGEELEDIFEALEDTKENAIQYLMKQNPNCVVLEKQGVDRVTCLKDLCRLGGDVCVCCADSDDDFRRRRRDTATDYGDQANGTIYVTEMLHKVDLVVNERGTEGGAATATLIDRISSQITFLVNGPFLMIIREETTRLPLFYGSIFSPK